MPQIDDKLESLWRRILDDENHHLIVGLVEGVIVSTCTLSITLNLTNNGRGWGIIENVLTHQDYRNKGYATLILNFAREIAIREDCYKITLTTGSKRESTLRFYEKAGYNQRDKTAFVQWLDHHKP